MTNRFGKNRSGRVVAVAVLVVSAALLAGAAHSARGSVPARAAVATPARHFEPQGSFGQFVAKCLYSHSGPNDPIVWPGRPGRSHRHDFYGATGTNAFSTPKSLAGGGSTCDKPGDDAAYWQPTLYDHDRAVVPLEAHAYYRAAPGVAPTAVQTFPFGLAMIAGDPTATSSQPGDATGWTCGVRTQLDKVPPTCPRTAPLRLVLTFPDCWDGAHTDTLNHRDHVAYSTDGNCPADHAVPIPQLTLTVKYPVTGAGHDFRLASGNIFSAHGDFFNAWDPAALEREIDHCIHQNVVCDVASNHEDIAPFFTQ